MLFALISYGSFLLSVSLYFLLLVGYGVTIPLFQEQDGFVAPAAVNAGMLAMFGVLHSGMARSGFKEFCRRLVPEPLERSTYVLIASVTLAALSVLWQAMPGEIWHLQGSPATYTMRGLFAIGLLLVVVSTFLIDHLELFGLRQAWNAFRGGRPREQDFVTPSLYKFVRHPMMLGMILILWATPRMDASHLMLATGMTLYTIIGTIFEERDLVRQFGERYQQYKREVPMFRPRFSKKFQKKVNTHEK